MASSVALISGATGAIGSAISDGLARLGWRVILLGRNKERLERLYDDLSKRFPNAEVGFELCDVTVPSSIQDLVARWTGPLHVLINNAAVAPSRRTLSIEGLEVQFATNILGYVRLQHAFADILTASAPARVVNVASYWAGDLDMDDLQFHKRTYDNHVAYRQSKQANRMLSRAFADLWVDRGVVVNSCHPGDVRSRLSTDLGFGGHESASKAAATPLFLAADPDTANVTGQYFEDGRAVACRFSFDPRRNFELLSVCQNFL